MAKTSFNIEDAKNLLHQLNQFHLTLLQEWSHVSTQWSNLKETWHDQQFNEFEPLFDKLSSTYDDELKKCENYMLFLIQKIDIAEKGKFKLGEFATKIFETLGTVQTGLGLLSGSPPSEIPSSQAQPVSFIEQPQESAAMKNYESLPGIARSPSVEDKLAVTVQSDKETGQKRRKEEAEKAANAFNKPKTSGSGKPPKKPI